MEFQETRLLDIAHCIVPKEEILMPDPEPEKPIPIMPGSMLMLKLQNITVPASAVLRQQEVIVAPPTTQKIPIKATTTAPSTTTTITPKTPIDSTTNPSQLIDDTVPSMVVQDQQIEDDRDEIYSSDSDDNTSFTSDVITNPVDRLTETIQNETIENSQSNYVENQTSNDSNNSNVEMSNNITEKVLSSHIDDNASASTANDTDAIQIQPVLNNASASSTTSAEIVLDDIETISKAPEQENYLYEVFSPPAPIMANPERSSQQQIVLVEEPPETIADDLAPAA